ncbi:uncharacterized protein BDV17DRAFT_68354 [Aspergillus undulatus]|uniref:uncharacterized protein n=1 Tax=Aspergillus undulatus TaxID=1810928 RepID=UPI003CCD5F2E
MPDKNSNPRKPFAITWTPEQKDRLWNAKILHRHLEWREFHKLDLFPGHSEASVQTAWSRLQRERGGPRSRLQRERGGPRSRLQRERGGPRSRRGRKPGLRTRKASIRVSRGVVQSIAARRSAAATVRGGRQRLRRPLRLREAVNETASESDEYEDASSDEGGSVIRAKDIMLDDEVSSQVRCYFRTNVISHRRREVKPIIQVTRMSRHRVILRCRPRKPNDIPIIQRATQV